MYITHLSPTQIPALKMAYAGKSKFFMYKVPWHPAPS